MIQIHMDTTTLQWNSRLLEALPRPLPGPNPFPFPEDHQRTIFKTGIPGFTIALPRLVDVPKLLSGWGLFNDGADVSKIIFTLNNKKGNYTDYVLQHKADPTNLKESKWDKSQKTIVVIHGYMEDGSNGPTGMTKRIHNAYVDMKRPENLIMVDWSTFSRQLNYWRSAANTVMTGKRVAEFIMSLVEANYIKTLDDVHIVGMSLGGQTAGVAGYHCHQISGKKKVGRISGVDPAGPAFINVTLDRRLDPSDAQFVDVIHTNMGFDLSRWGIPYPSGHIDFYPNGGEVMPGCKTDWGETLVCSHLRATEYYVNSITKAKDYKSCPCDSYKKFKAGACDCSKWVRMGEFVDIKARGSYYLDIPLDEE